MSKEIFESKEVANGQIKPEADPVIKEIKVSKETEKVVAEVKEPEIKPKEDVAEGKQLDEYEVRMAKIFKNKGATQKSSFQ